jgi:antitoxin (DNA-binding transcriptional repressor) of toxin-antitoxin stability system
MAAPVSVAPPLEAALPVIRLGEHRIVNPPPGEPPFLSAASGTAWSDDRLYSVGDDQASVAEFTLEQASVLEALRAGVDVEILEPGIAERIIPDVLPLDPSERATMKADFEALTVVLRRDIDALDHPARAEILRRFPNGLLMMSGSGGMSWRGVRRSTCVVYSLDAHGHISGLPAKISLEALHESLQGCDAVNGELNIEGMAVYGQSLLLAQRGNSIDDDGQPAKNLLIDLDLGEVLESLYTDLSVGALELRSTREYDLGSLPVEQDGETHQVKIDFTDLDAVTGDPLRRLVFTAAGEGPDGSPVQNVIAGSAVGVLSADGALLSITPLADRTIKLEGIDARYNPTLGSIDLLLVSDADDPEVPAPLFAARLEG